MVESIVSTWESLPWVLRWPIGFAFNVILLRGIIANSITGYIRKHGLSGIIKDIGRFILVRTPRKQAIWAHHKEQHPAKSITGCDLETCQTI